jgi:hypothetical protein
MCKNYTKTLLFAASFLVANLAFLSAASAQTPGFDSTHYKKALWMTTRMYGGQRCGNNNWLLYGHPLSATGGSFVKDADGTYDLTGGWFDCGDHVKFGQTQFYAGYVLLKGYSEFSAGYDDRYAYDYAGYNTAGDWTFEGKGHAPNGIPDILDEVKHVTDYYIKCTRDENTFYAQVGDGTKDHMQWVTATFMATTKYATGGESDFSRDVMSNIKVSGGTASGQSSLSPIVDGSIASLAGAALALMSRLYKPYDAVYAQTCLDHAKYAYAYATKYKTNTQGAPGFYSTTSTPLNDYAILLAEMYWATQDETYKTAALAMTVDTEDGSKDVQGNAFGMDYVNVGDLGVYNLYLLGKAGADAAFTGIVNKHYLGNVQSDGQFAQTGQYGPLRYNGSAALTVALWIKRNGATDATKKFIYNNIDYILGKNSENLSFIFGFSDKHIMHPHHRNLYMSDGNVNDALKQQLTVPTKNEQHGYMVGGTRDPSLYTDILTNVQQSEGGIDYNAGLVGALAWINSSVAPVNKFTVEEIPNPVITGVDDAVDATSLVVFPNPSSGTFGFNAPSNTTIRVFDEMGRMVLNFNTDQYQNFGGQLTQGLYHVAFYKGDQLLKSVNVVKN